MSSPRRQRHSPSRKRPAAATARDAREARYYTFETFQSKLQHYQPVDELPPKLVECNERAAGHALYVEQSGNPQGAPALFLHGGPGGGCALAMRSRL